MEAISQLTSVWGTKLQLVSLLWLEGFREACCLHRVVIYSLRSRQIMVRTGQCFLLNGFIFLGSIFILRSVIIPTLHWILPGPCPDIKFQEPCVFEGLAWMYGALRFGLIQLFDVLWFWPLYILSFIISTIWYNDIAQHGLLTVEKQGHPNPSPTKNEPSISKTTSDTDKPTDLGGAMIGIAEIVYSLILMNIFFLEVTLAGYVPYIGSALRFILLSWLYAYYCFEYKWNFSGLSLDKRLEFFESNWAFFAGFGSPCVLSTFFFFSPLLSNGVLATLFPLFVLTAAGSDANKVIDSQRKKWTSAGLGRLPIFYAADSLSDIFTLAVEPPSVLPGHRLLCRNLNLLLAVAAIILMRMWALSLIGKTSPERIPDDKAL